MQFRTAAAAVLLAAAAIGAGATAASASTGPSSNGQAGQLTGNRATSYADPFFGPVQCNETQHAAFDTVSCKSTTGAPLANVSPGQIGSVGWNSDWTGNPALLPSHAATGALAFTVSADGLSYAGQATYPAG